MLIVKELAAIAIGLTTRDQGMRQIAVGNMLQVAYEGGMSGDDLDRLADKLKDAEPKTINSLNLLSQHGGLKPYMAQRDTQWIYDQLGDLVGFYRDDNGIRWAWGLDGKQHLVGEDSATSPNDLTDAITMLAGAGLAAKVGGKGLGIVLAGATEGGAEDEATSTGLGKLLDKGRSTFNDSVQKAKDSVPKNFEEAKARAYNKAVDLGNRPTGDSRPGPGPAAPPPTSVKEAGKEVAKHLGKQAINAAKKKYLGH